MPQSCFSEVLAVGAHQKNTIAASRGEQVFISQHIGDLDTLESFEVFRRTICDFETLYDWHPQMVAYDLHPDYLPTQYASGLPEPRLGVQHHYAHVLACMAENELADVPVLGVCWDGTGYGTDGTIWGGEWLRVTADGFERAAYLRPFSLPGGEQAVQEPRRSALGLLYELYGDAVFAEMPNLALAPLQSFTTPQRHILRSMLRHHFNAPVTSSMGRLFDGVAALLGLCQQASYEGQAAMALEFAADASVQAYYNFVFDPADSVMDWGPLLGSILNDLRRGTPAGVIAAKFRNTLTEMIATVAGYFGEQNVVLTGGCFQNRYLTEKTIERLRAGGFTPYWNRQVPPNDGGIALGQVMAAAREYRRNGSCV